MSFLGSFASPAERTYGFQGSRAENLQQPIEGWMGLNDRGTALGGINQQQAFLNALQAQGGIGNQASVFAQQQALANQLGQMAQGGGPNPALEQYRQLTGQNIQNQAALMAGQRGAGANAGLLARQIAQQGGNIQQQAAGQQGLMQAQQQMAALGALQNQQAQMANLAGTQVSQQGNALTGLNQLAQNQQQQSLNAINAQNQMNVAMQSNINDVNAGMAGKNMGTQAGIVGGILGGGAQVAAASAGVPKKAHGGMIGYAQGDVVSYLTGGKHKMSDGGVVPGKPLVMGDDEANDIVDAKLSPGEIVIPRSILMGKDPVKGAAMFVQQELAKHGSGKNKLFNGGVADNDFMFRDPAMEKNSVDAQSSPFTTEEQGWVEDPRMIAIGATNATYPELDIARAPRSPMLDQTAKAEIPSLDEESAGEEMPAPAPQTTGAVPQSSGGYNQMMKGMQDYGQAQADMAKAQEKTIQAGIQEMKAAQDAFQMEKSKVQSDIDSAAKEYADGKIEPNRIWQNMGTGQKVATSIGLILGGLSSGLTGKENPAAQYLDKLIDNDIAAQRADLGKKENLLGVLYKKYGNLTDAMNMAKAYQLQTVDMQLKADAAKYSDPMAKARAMQQSGMLRAQMDALQNKVAANQALMASGRAEDRILSIPDKELRKTALKEMGDVREMSQMKDQIFTLFDKVAKDQTLQGGGAFRKSPSLDSLTMALMTFFKKKGLGNVSESEQGLLRDIGSAGFWSMSDVAKRKRQDLAMALKIPYQPTLEAYKIPYSNIAGKYKEGGDRAIKLGEPVKGKK